MGTITTTHTPAQSVPFGATLDEGTVRYSFAEFGREVSIQVETYDRKRRTLHFGWNEPVLVFHGC